MLCIKCGKDRTEKFCKRCWTINYNKKLTNEERLKRNKIRRSERIKYREQEKLYSLKYRKKHRYKLNQDSKKFYQNNTELCRKLGRESYYKCKFRVLEKCGGSFCINCGCSDIKALEINYKKGGHTKDGFPIGSKLLNELDNDRIDPNLFDVRCRPCNALHYLGLKGVNTSKFDIKWKD